MATLSAAGRTGLVLFATLFALMPGAASGQAAIDVPAVAGITIDGQGDDWGDQGLRIETLTSAERILPTPPDLDASVRLGWDARGLLLFVRVADDTFIEAGDSLSLWSGDSVELILSPDRDSADIYQVVLSPGIDPEHPTLRHHLHDRRLSTALRLLDEPVQAARTRTDEGYLLEALLPVANIGVEATRGKQVAFQIVVNDVDEPESRQQVHWYPFPGAYADSEKMYSLRLARRGGPAVRGIALGEYEMFRRLRVSVLAPEELGGEKLEIRAGRKVLARATLAAAEGQSEATLRLPLPSSDTQYADLRAYASGRYLAPVVVPSLEQGRRTAFSRAPLRFEPFVFSGDPFPRVDFEQPSLVEDLIGPYRLDVTFYDADYDEVTTAKETGRYGAIVEILTEEGETHRRFHTLFRHPESIRWYRTDLHLNATLPPQLGIDSSLVADQKELVGEYWVCPT